VVASPRDAASAIHSRPSHARNRRSIAKKPCSNGPQRAGVEFNRPVRLAMASWQRSR
jgi:hypothetical protein